MCADKIFENLLGNVWLKDPHCWTASVDCGSPICTATVVVTCLPTPRIRSVVIPVDVLVELKSDPTDHSFVATVSPSQTSCTKATKMFVWTDNYHVEIHTSGLNSRCNPGTGCSVNDKVIGSGVSSTQWFLKKNKAQQCNCGQATKCSHGVFQDHFCGSNSHPFPNCRDESLANVSGIPLGNGLITRTAS